MRLVTTNLVDAFAELDEFPMSQRKAFLGRAVRRWWVLVLPMVFAGLATLFIMIGNIFTLEFVIDLIRSSNSLAGYGIGYDLTLFFSAIVVPLGAGGLALLISRDICCRLRIKQIIKLRFNCAQCGYKLAGLAITEDNKATCPECGLLQSVDPSLHELTKIHNTT